MITLTQLLETYCSQISETYKNDLAWWLMTAQCHPSCSKPQSPDVHCFYSMCPFLSLVLPMIPLCSLRSLTSLPSPLSLSIWPPPISPISRETVITCAHVFCIQLTQTPELMPPCWSPAAWLMAQARNKNAAKVAHVTHLTERCSSVWNPIRWPVFLLHCVDRVDLAASQYGHYTSAIWHPLLE